MRVDKGKAAICQEKMITPQLAGVGLNCARSGCDGHKFGHSDGVDQSRTILAIAVIFLTCLGLLLLSGFRNSIAFFL
jgi:hypothetical protein